MHRIDGSGAQPNQNGTGKAGFTEGNPGLMIPPTHLTDDWCNAVQEEIANTVTGSGLTLSKPDNGQLFTAVHGSVGYLSFAQGGITDADITPTPAAEFRAADILELGWSGGTGRVIGLAPPTDGKIRKRILNYPDNGEPLILAHDNSGAAAGRRFKTPTFGDLKVNGHVDLLYLFGYWTVVSHGPAGDQQYDIGLVTYPNAPEVVYVNENGARDPRLRLTMISPLEGIAGDPMAWNVSLDSGGPSRNSLLGSGYLYFPIKLPTGAELQRVKVGCKNVGIAADWQIDVVAHDIDQTPAFAPTETPILSTPATGPTNGDFVIDALASVVAQAGRYITLQIRSPSDAFTNVASVEWIEIWWLDPGPRNY